MTVTSSPPAPALEFTALGGWPQVDLMPPEVRAGRRLRRTKRMLVFVIVGILAIAMVGYTGAELQARSASSDLEAVQQETARLTLAQSKFAEVPKILGEIGNAETARQQGTSTEILWKSYLDAMRAITPAGVAVDNLTVAAAEPMKPAPQASDPLAAPSMGSIQFTAKSLTTIGTSDWIDALDAVPGFADAWFSTERIDEEKGVTYYVVTASVQINSSTLANRFAVTKGN
jgi:hypothetical protein